MPSKPALLLLVQKYVQTDPASAAHVLETFEVEESAEILSSITPTQAIETFKYFHDTHAGSLLTQLPQTLAVYILEKLEPQQVSTIFLRLEEEERAAFLNSLTEQRKKQIQEILTYPENSAGRIMSTDFLAFHSDLKVKETIQRIRQQAQKKHISSYVYVVDIHFKLIGIMNMHDMMVSPIDAPLGSIMRTNIFSVNCFMDREAVANELSNRKYFAVPVVDAQERLIGIIHAEQLIEDVQEEASEDVQKMFGAGGDEKAFSPVFFSLKKRIPWLYVNLATAFLAGFVVSCFEDIIKKITILAIYLPVVAGQGGNAGAQSLAVVMRGLVMREIPAHRAIQLMLKETRIGLINGILIGGVTATISWLWHGNPYLGLVVGLGMLVNLIIAGFSGAGIPLAMKALGFDPAQSSNIVLTTITDVMGFFTFLGFAILFQNYLI